MQRAATKILKITSYDYKLSKRGGALGGFRGFDLFGRRWGWDRSTVYVKTEKYLDRWILYVNGWTLRLHKFWRGDDDRASHTHPWWFITFPLCHWYWERVYHQGTLLHTRAVRGWRFHFRPADFEHYVIGGCGCEKYRVFWTFVITGARQHSWGFYPEPGVFVPYYKYE